MAQHRCAVYSCLHTIPKSVRFCTDHWRMVPPSLQGKLCKFGAWLDPSEMTGALEAIERETARRAAFHQQP